MMRMASPMSASRSLSVSLFARARIFAAITVPGVVASSEGFAFFGLLHAAKAHLARACVNGDKSKNPGEKLMPANAHGSA